MRVVAIMSISLFWTCACSRRLDTNRASCKDCSRSPITCPLEAFARILLALNAGGHGIVRVTTTSQSNERRNVRIHDGSRSSVLPARRLARRSPLVRPSQLDSDHEPERLSHRSPLRSVRPSSLHSDRELGSLAKNSFAPQEFGHPLRAMIFIDGSQFFFAKHGGQSVFKTELGANWERHYRLDYSRLTALIARCLQRELSRDQLQNRNIDVVRTIVVSSLRSNSFENSSRVRMFREMEAAGFEVHTLDWGGSHAREKCVDIDLTVKMIHYAANDGYDICVLVSGDRDFVPALKYIRSQFGKRVAICSVLQQGSGEMLRTGMHVRDFKPIWLDHHVKSLVVRRGRGNKYAQSLLHIITEHLLQQPALTTNSLALGQYLARQPINDQSDQSALAILKTDSSLLSFLKQFPENILLGDVGDDFVFSVTLLAPELDHTEDESLAYGDLGTEFIDDEQYKIHGTNEFSDDQNDVMKSEIKQDDQEESAAEPFDLKSLKKADLKAKLQDLGLKVSGTKAELVSRLKDSVT